MDGTGAEIISTIVITLIAAAWIALPCILAIQKGRSWLLWILLSLVLPVISLVILALLPSRKKKAEAYSSEEKNQKQGGEKQVMKTPSGKRSYTEEFKKEVVRTALTGGVSLSEVARMHGVHLTLVRNWKEKYESEITSRGGTENIEDLSPDEESKLLVGDAEVPAPTLIWHIDRARFTFSEPDEYKEWQKEKKVFFDFSPASSDDGGETVFLEPNSAEEDFEITEDRGLVKITLEKDGPLITAWVGVTAELTEGLDEETLNDWAYEQGGWASCSIHLGDFEATIEEDDGGDWRFPHAEERHTKSDLASLGPNGDDTTADLTSRLNELLGANIEGIENKIYERGMLRKLTGSTEAQVSIWLKPHGDEGDEGDGEIALYVDIEVEKGRVRKGFLDEFTDYITEKFYEAIEDLSPDDSDALNDRFYGVIVTLNNEEL